MPTVTINIAGAGTPTTTGPSFAGHMWYSLDDGNGNTYSYGFAPVDDATGINRAFGPGMVHPDDNTTYQGPREYTKTIELTQAQYDAMKNFGDNPGSAGFSTDYNGLTNSCIDFTWKALEEGGLNPAGFQGDVLPTWNADNVGEILVASNDLFNRFIDFAFGLGNAINNIEIAVNDWWDAARNWVPPRYDPLALDLDGDGIETVGANGAVLFDHNGDGIQTATGWVKADDGLLVLDRNGNGKIDTGAELFGVDTVLANGQKASNGFAALRDFDANGDNVFDVHDTRFADVRIWRDLSQDGITQAGELFTLQSLGIAALNLNATNRAVNLGNGNIQTASAAYVRTDGTTGEAAEIGLCEVAANLEFAQNPFYRQFTDSIPLTEQASLLPQLRGSGMVRDLREAASLSPVLANVLTQFSAAATRGEQMALMDELLEAWAATSDMKIYQSGWYQSAMVADPQTGPGIHATIDSVESSTLPVNLYLGLNQMSDTRFHALEAFNGDLFSPTFQQIWGAGLGARISDSSDVLVWSTLPEGVQLSAASGPAAGPPDTSFLYTSISLAQPQTDLLDLAYGALNQSIYDGLILQTRLKPYLDAIALQVDTTGIHQDFSGVTAALVALRQTDPANALINMIELHKMEGASLYSLGWNELPMLRTWIEEAPNDAALQTVLAELGVKLNPADWTGSENFDLMLGQAQNDNLTGHEGNDLLSGGSGNDSLNGGSGNDILDGGVGNDYLEGGINDDIIDGGAGNDTLYGDTGNDTYLFKRNSGQDSISDYDTTAGNIDTIRLAADIALTDVTLWRDASNLYLGISGTDDKISVENWYTVPAYRVERIVFADNTVWDATTLAAAKFMGTDIADDIYGTTDADVLEGFGGNDQLSGDAGNDILDGGTGNDTLDGGTGNDIYLFGRNSGQDTVNDYDTTAGNIDAIRLAADIAPTDVTLWRDASNLYLGIDGSDDRISVEGWYDVPAYRVEQIEFADDTVWGTTQLQTAIFLGTNGADQLMGTDQIEIFDGLGGNDNIDGGSGGNDIYLFGRGYGQDTINDYDTTAGNIDTIRLAADIALSDVTLWRDTSNLYLGISGTDDIITVESWYDVPAYRVEQIEFADNTVWGASTLAAAKFMGRDIADNIYGTTGADVLEGFGGNDQLSGDAGNDILDGGTGNDTLEGGTGNDIYLFGRGYGQDTISDYDTAAGNSDTIRLAADTALSDVTLWRDTSNLYLDINGTNDRISVESWYDAPAHRVEKITFSDGTVWNTATLAAAKFAGTDTADNLYGTTGADTLEGWGGNDYLSGDLGNDTLDGGTGNDILEGDAGNDIYLFARDYGQDSVSETSGSADVVRFKAGVMPGDVEVYRDANNLYFGIRDTSDRLSISNWYLGSSYRIERTEFADGTLWDSAALTAKLNQATEYADHYWGSTGNDTFTALGGDDQLTGNEGNDTLNGGAGNDLLNGGSGADTLLGGIGNDTYFVDNVADIVTENADEGADTVQSSITYILAANFENLALTGAATINGSGNTLDNIIAGNTADNVLDGGAGNDTLIGGQGNDTYVLDNPLDAVNELAGEGTDTIQAGFTYTLGANLEKLTLTGTTAIDGYGNELGNTLTGNIAVNYLWGYAGNDSLSGGAGNDILDGGTGNDSLNGGAGVDFMTGGLGNDTYTVDNAGDVVTELANEGTDKVNSSISYTLGAYLENLTLTGSGNLNGTGNDLANILVGNAGANALTGGLGNDTLNGGVGVDILIGGSGDDIYVVDNAADVVTENADEGVDTVQSSITWTLAVNIEKLTLTGSTAINGTGNALDNILTGNAYDNILDGGAGIDILIGGAGNDTYVLDSTADIVTEGLNGGTDTIQCGFDFTLTADLENLTLTGTAALNGFGNELANALTGNGAANYLWGGAGADTLNGGGGNDLLQGGADNDILTDNTGNNLFDGGAGADTFTGGAGNELFIGGAGNDIITTGTGADIIAFNRGSGKDTVKASTGADNVLSLGGGIGYADMVFSKSSNNLILTTGTNESITFQNWYAATANRSVTTLQMITEAMAAYDVNSADSLLNKKVQAFDFNALVNAFDAERTANPTLVSWSLTNALPGAHLASSETSALGGDLAYRYGLNSALTGIGLTAAQDVLIDPQFGNQAQLLRPWSTLNGGVMDLI